METLLTKEGYFKRFFELLDIWPTHYDAYVMLEAELHEKYGLEKYSSYESFRVMKHRFHKQKNTENQAIETPC